MPDVIPARTRSRKQIRDLADKFLKIVQPEALLYPQSVDVEGFAELHLPRVCGVEIDYHPKIPMGIAGLTDAETMKIYLDPKLADSDIDSDRRFFRSTLAHETGHALMHVKEIKNFKSQIGAQELAHYRVSQNALDRWVDPEWQAWAFADEFLMPIQAFNKAWEQYRDVSELARIFDLNPAYIQKRLKNLKLK